MTRRSRPTAAAAALLALTGAACGGGVTLTDSDAALVTSSTKPTTTTTTAAESTTTGPRNRELSADADDLHALAFVAPTTSTEVTPEADTPKTTTGSGGAPVTTIGGGGGADTGSIYTGLLGDLGADEVVTAAVAPAPATVDGVLPLTGEPGQVPNRPAAVVKIDNGSAARPQSGLNAADIVVEEEVEGGVTRFAAIFHSTNAIVGPVRSGRTTDIGVISSLGEPLLIYSGANDVTDTLLLRRDGVQNRSAGRSSGYWRDRSRRAPSNLYTDTAPQWASASGGRPPAQFTYEAAGPDAPGVADTEVTLAYRANRASWSWDGERWLRSQGGRAHMTAAGDQVSATNVVVIETDRVATGMVDSSGATVPEFPFVGSGPATVYRDGRAISGRWTRPTLRSAATLTTGGDVVIPLAPGRTWIELVEAGAGIHR